MLDEGKIDRDEYDRLKADLLAEESSTANVMEGKPAGWYNDPSGKSQHQAYWDGETWTGETRTQFQAKVSEAHVAPKSGKKSEGDTEEEEGRVDRGHGGHAGQEHPLPG